MVPGVAVGSIRCPDHHPHQDILSPKRVPISGRRNIIVCFPIEVSHDARKNVGAPRHVREVGCLDQASDGRVIESVRVRETDITWEMGGGTSIS